MWRPVSPEGPMPIRGRDAYSCLLWPPIAPFMPLTPLDIHHNPTARFPLYRNDSLQIAITSGRSAAYITGILKATPSLLHERNAFGHTPLHLAIQFNCNLDSIKVLLECGADVNGKDCCFETPLHTASSRGRFDVFPILLEYEADINARNMNEQTALELSLANEEVQLDTIHFLLTNGADATVMDGCVNCILQAAIKNSSVTLDMFKMLLEWGAVPSEQNLYAERRLPFKKLLIQYILVLGPEAYFCWDASSFPNLSLKLLNQRSFGWMAINWNVSLSAFRDTCVYEIIEMQKDKISHNYTLFEFICEWCCKSKETLNNIDLDPSLVKEVLLRLGRYVSCKDLLHASLKRCDVLAEVVELDIHTKTACKDCSKERKVNLNYYTISKLATYLSRDDLINLAVAYMPNSRKSKPIPFIPLKRKSEGTLKRLPLLKRLQLSLLNP